MTADIQQLKKKKNFIRAEGGKKSRKTLKKEIFTNAGYVKKTWHWMGTT
jgi:hypothetical protein